LETLGTQTPSAARVPPILLAKETHKLLLRSRFNAGISPTLITASEDTR
jgi:hypothetical protein